MLLISILEPSYGASEPTEYPWGSLGPYTPVVAYNKLYWGAYDGHLYAFDVNTGKIVWKLYSGNTTETPYGTWPFWFGPIVADGKVYMGTGEHSPTQPILRGFRLYCVDAHKGPVEIQSIWEAMSYHGPEIWSIAGAMKPYAVVEGMLLAVNIYDGMLYCFGKGETAVEVSVSPKTVAKGDIVLIEGAVLDQSPAQPGTPCVSKESMTAWMEYLHMQKPMPKNVKGVPLVIYAIAPSGIIIEISTRIEPITTDPSTGGQFSLAWTPPDEGRYRIIVVFPGSESYWSSYAATDIVVTSAPQTEATVAPTTIEIAIAVVAVIAITDLAINVHIIRKQRKRT